MGCSAACQSLNTRSMTAAFSADPALKYLAAVSIEACPSNAWTWAGSAPLLPQTLYAPNSLRTRSR